MLKNQKGNPRSNIEACTTTGGGRGRRREEEDGEEGGGGEGGMGGEEGGEEGGGGDEDDDEEEVIVLEAVIHTSNLARVVCSNSNRDSSSLVRSSNLRCAKDELVSPCVSILSRRDDSSANCSLRAARSPSNSATRPACSCRAIWSTDNCWTTVRYFFSTCKTCNVHYRQPSYCLLQLF